MRLPSPMTVNPTAATAPRRWALPASIVMLVVTAGCSGDSMFQIARSYQAPQNGYLVAIEVRGTIPQGSDSSEEYETTVIITPLAGEGSGVRVQLSDSSTEAVYQIDGGPQHRAPWDWKTDDGTLTRILTDAQLKTASAAELQETVRVINAASAGPLSVIEPRQTKALRAVE